MFFLGVEVDVCVSPEEERPLPALAGKGYAQKKKKIKQKKPLIIPC